MQEAQEASRALLLVTDLQLFDHLQQRADSQRAHNCSRGRLHVSAVLSASCDTSSTPKYPHLSPLRSLDPRLPLFSISANLRR